MSPSEPAGPFSKWRQHPWHGLGIGPNPPALVHAYIELTPYDLVKYEIDKESGYLRVDRPQRTSSQPPALYGFIPRTYSGPRVGRLMATATEGDGDPLDICVLSERPITRSEVIITARVIGGIPMVDHGTADDKLVGVLANDPIYAQAEEIGDLPEALADRLMHYFATYKLIPGEESAVSVGRPYGREHAYRVLTAAIEDYRDAYGHAAGSSPASG